MTTEAKTDISDKGKALAQRGLLWAGRQPLGARVLRFYQAQGLVQPEVEPTPPPPPPPAPSDGRAELLQGMWDRILPRMPGPSYEDVSEEMDDDSLPPLDRRGVDVSTLTDDQRQWYEQGFVLKERFIPDEILDAYWGVRSKLDRPGGWSCPAPYMHVPEVLDLACYRPLTDLLEELIGEPMGVMLNLTGIVSTERNWHQDDYLNYPGTKTWYAAVWFAIDDVDPDSGPFQYVPGSHKWPALRRDQVKMFLPPDERDTDSWPKLTERFLNELIEQEIETRKAEVRSFVAGKGDILIWHGRLMHRGSVANVPGRQRMSFISHYTGLNHWALGPDVSRHRDGGLYFNQDVPLDA